MIASVVLCMDSPGYVIFPANQTLPMPEIKTRETKLSVGSFLNRKADEEKRKDAFSILEMIQRISGKEPKIWGDSIMGFGKVKYRYASGHSGEICLCGFSPRKQQFSLYLTCNPGYFGELLGKPGRYKAGKRCLYIKKRADVDKQVLETLIEKAVSTPWPIEQ